MRKSVLHYISRFGSVLFALAFIAGMHVYLTRSQEYVPQSYMHPSQAVPKQPISDSPLLNEEETAEEILIETGTGDVVEGTDTAETGTGDINIVDEDVQTGTGSTTGTGDTVETETEPEILQ